MVHYAGYTPRFHPSDFATFSNDGVGADWPIDYAELQPYYAALEQELPVAGESWPSRRASWPSTTTSDLP